MEQHLKTNLGVTIQQVGQERPIKQNFSNVIEAVTEDKILKLGDIVAGILPEGDVVNHVTRTVQYQYTK